MTDKSVVGRVVEIWRYSVKSMMGETLNATALTEHGLLGDRAHALIDAQTGKVASAKNPRAWPNLFDFRATYVEPPCEVQSLPPVRITLPDGTSLTSDDAAIDARLSAAIGRSVRLAKSIPAEATAEGYWPDDDWIADRDTVFEFTMPSGTFFDGAAVHVLTTTALDHLRSLSPASRFEVARFRPNVVIEPTDGSSGFAENAWIGRSLALGEARLRIARPAPRCVMTTLAQGSLPKDPTILRAAVEQNDGAVGVYASVLATGRIRRGDLVQLT